MNMFSFFYAEPAGQGFLQVGELLLALILSSLIGLERELKQKSAGLRTHTLVGLASALIVLVSKYGFADVLVDGQVVVDPSRVAAQIVSGIGFIGGGLIFVHKDIVRGLTTAAIIWLTAAVGMACGAGLPLLALLATAGHFFVVYGYSPIVRRISGSHSRLRIVYNAEHDAILHIMQTCSNQRFTIHRFEIQQNSLSKERTSTLLLNLQGKEEEIAKLASSITAIPEICSVSVEAIGKGGME